MIKKIFLFLCVFSSQGTFADEFMTFSNGMTCWKNDVGHIYGCSGGVDTGDTGVFDNRTGKRYEFINPQPKPVNPKAGTQQNDRYLSCSDIKALAEEYGEIVKGMQTYDIRYGAMYRKMERYENLYSDNCE